MLDQESLSALVEAVKKLDAGFTGLPVVESKSPGFERLGEVLNATAERLQDNYPYFHPLYAGQMLKLPHPVARLAYALAMCINPNNHALDGGRASTAMEREAVAQREAAAAAQLARERARAERQHQFDRELRRRDMLDLRMAAARQDAFAKKVEDSHIQAARQQYTASLMAELDRAINEAVPLTKPSPSFSTLYRQNQRSGLFYTTPEDSDE